MMSMLVVRKGPPTGTIWDEIGGTASADSDKGSKTVVMDGVDENDSVASSMDEYWEM